MSMLNFFKNAYHTIYEKISHHFKRIFGTREVDETTLQELEKTLLEADTGITITRRIIDHARKRAQEETLSGAQLQELVREQLYSTLSPYAYDYDNEGPVYMLVGVNGSGKTSCAAKLAYKLQQEGKHVLLAAADTFRAAAIEQLMYFAQQCDIPCVAGSQGQDPASIVYTACQRYIQEQFDAVIIDTAGRLQTKQNLMQEVAKMVRVAHKHIPHEDMTTLLTLDALLGQNSYDQAYLFHKATSVDGIVLTKMDATAKGGIVFSVVHDLHVPIAYTTYGERLTDIAQFAPYAYVDNLLAE